MERTLIYTDTNEKFLVNNGWQKQKDALLSVLACYVALGLPPLTGKGEVSYKPETVTIPAANHKPFLNNTMIKQVTQPPRTVEIPGDMSGMCDLFRLFNDTAVFLFDQLTGKETAHLAIGGGDNKTFMPLNKEKAIELLQKPDGYNELVTAIKNLSESAIKGIEYRDGQSHSSYNIKEIALNFTINEDGTLQFSERILNKINEAGNYYITSKAGNRIYRFVQDIVKSYYENRIDNVTKILYYPTPKNTPAIHIETILREVIESLNDENQTFTANKHFAHSDYSFKDSDDYLKNL